MFNAEADAKTTERVNRMTEARTQDAYNFVLRSKHGRAFVSILLDVFGLYEPCDNETAEGTRRAALSIRNTAMGLGFRKEWQRMETEKEEFVDQIKTMLDQTAAKEDKDNDYEDIPF